MGCRTLVQASSSARLHAHQLAELNKITSFPRLHAHQ